MYKNTKITIKRIKKNVEENNWKIPNAVQVSRPSSLAYAST